MQHNQDAPFTSKKKRKESNGTQKVVTKKNKNSGEAILPYYSKESISIIPTEIVRWILSFVTSPKDFVRLRTVCRQWNTLLGNLFFGTLKIEKWQLFSILSGFKRIFERLPFTFAKGMLTVSAGTRHVDSAVHMVCPVETTGIEKETQNFTVDTQVLYKRVKRCNNTHILFHFSILACRITCNVATEEDRSLFSAMSAPEQGYAPKIHSTGFDSIDLWHPVRIPEYNLEVRTIAGMFSSILNQTYDSDLQMSIYSIHDGRILLISMSPDTRCEEDSSIRFDYFFKKKKEEEQKITRWEPMRLVDLIATDKTIGQRFVVSNEDLLFRQEYNRNSIEDALREVGEYIDITVCIATDSDGVGSMITKYTKIHSTFQWLVVPY